MVKNSNIETVILHFVQLTRLINSISKTIWKQLFDWGSRLLTFELCSIFYQW